MTHPTRPPAALTPVAFAYGATCVLALVALRYLERPLQVYASPHPGALLAGREPLQGLLWGLAVGGLLAASGQAATRWTAWGRRLTRFLRQLVGHLHPGDAMLLAVLSGVGEELLFRGIVLPYAGLLGSSALFGVAHLVPRRGLWPWSLWAVAAGLLLGYAALACGGLLAPILGHCLVNAVGLVLLGERRR